LQISPYYEEKPALWSQWFFAVVFNPTRVEFPAACGVKEIGNSIPDTPLLAAG